MFRFLFFLSLLAAQPASAMSCGSGLGILAPPPVSFEIPSRQPILAPRGGIAVPSPEERKKLLAPGPTGLAAALNVLDAPRSAAKPKPQVAQDSPPVVHTASGLLVAKGPLPAHTTAIFGFRAERSPNRLKDPLYMSHLVGVDAPELERLVYASSGEKIAFTLQDWDEDGRPVSFEYDPATRRLSDGEKDVGELTEQGLVFTDARPDLSAFALRIDKVLAAELGLLQRRSAGDFDLELTPAGEDRRLEARAADLPPADLAKALQIESTRRGLAGGLPADPAQAIRRAESAGLIRLGADGRYRFTAEGSRGVALSGTELRLAPGTYLAELRRRVGAEIYRFHWRGWNTGFSRFADSKALDFHIRSAKHELTDTAGNRMAIAPDGTFQLPPGAPASGHEQAILLGLARALGIAEPVAGDPTQLRLRAGR